MPATEAQIHANRANAQHSSGPVTETGKAASAQNQFSHGMIGTSIRNASRSSCATKPPTSAPTTKPRKNSKP